MKTLISLMLILGIVCCGSTVYAGANDYNFVGKELVVVGKPKAHIHLNSSQDKFKGDRSYLLIQVRYTEKEVLTKDDINRILTKEEWENMGSGYEENLWVPAFQEENPLEPMCYDQFQLMRERLGWAKTLVVEEMKMGPKYVAVVRGDFGDQKDVIRVHPLRLSIRVKKTSSSK